MTASLSTQPPARSTPRAPASGDDRRGFVAKATAVLIGGLLVVFPFLAGLRVFADPLRRQGGRGVFLKITSLDSLADDGTPREFPVIADRRDSWNSYPSEPIGAVYLRRIEGPAKVEAFSVVCPHLGCFVGFIRERDIFRCPCHTSAFALDGAVISGPSPRGMDKLECQVRTEGGRDEVWVKFENFYTGRTEQVAKA
ncbi:MAG: Rieske 2Fe-2S domain-containing protein [Planctomycetia bacterium]|nr:Rieske 2Fe-2S domain-containing protein [Planctomycetia bacterium]